MLGRRPRPRLAVSEFGQEPSFFEDRFVAGRIARVNPASLCGHLPRRQTRASSASHSPDESALA